MPNCSSFDLCQEGEEEKKGNEEYKGNKKS